MITKQDSSSVESEAYRFLRTNIQFIRKENGTKSYLITSSLAGEGKSLTTANLGIIFAKNRKTVLVIDCDIRKPVQHKFHGIENTKGLSQLLAGKGKVRDYIKKTGIPNLYLIPSGPNPNNPAELINSIYFKKLIKECEQHFDYVFYDSPPIMIVSETTMMTTEIPGLLYLVNLGVIPENLLTACRKNLDKVNVKVSGIILNKVDLCKRFILEIL